MFKSLFVLALATFTAAVPQPRATGPTCTTFKMAIKATAQNNKIILPPNYNSSDPLGSITNSILSSGETGLGNILGGLVLTSGTYNINMMYCEPEVQIQNRSNTLQFLVHPATMTLKYWDFPVNPDKYSWVRYFSKRGYPMLAIDRLGAGASDHPNSITEVQANLQTNIHHEIVMAARSGGIAAAGRKFSKIIFVGGSYGSILGNQQAVQYPSDVDAYVLTAYTNDDQLLVPIFSLQTVASPAFLVDPTAYSGTDPGYLTNLNAQGRMYLYAGSYEQDVFNYDETNRGTITVGEALTANAGTTVASAYKGYVHLITGQEDSVFCGTGVNNLAGIVRQGNCLPPGKNIVAMSSSYFPAAKSFSYTIVPNTGHVTVLHSSVQQTFTSADSFLSSSGF